jgi:hypothetical protein
VRLFLRKLTRRPRNGVCEPRDFDAAAGCRPGAGNSRTIKISNENVFQANTQILAARTQRYPQFNVQLFGSYLLTPVSLSFPTGAYGNVGGTPLPNVNSPVVGKLTYLTLEQL